jgi:hypothetical protein
MVAIRPKEADAIAADLRKYSKTGEAPVNAQDAGALVAVLDKCDALMQEFFDILSDVPDEI